MVLTAVRTQQLLALRGRLVLGVPAEPPDQTELRLRLDKALARGGRLGDLGRHSG